MTNTLALFLPLLAAPQTDLDSTVDWMKTAAIPLERTVPGGSDKDLAGFGELVGDARVVALGEEVHGVGSFLSLKHRLFEYLVTEHGFTVLVLEDSFDAALALDEVIATGTGAGRAFDEGQFSWHVQNGEVRAIVEWMAEQNAKRDEADRLRLYGLDMQNVSAATRRLQKTLDELQEGPDAEERETLVAFRDFSWRVGSLPDASRGRMSADLARTGRRLVKEEEHLVAATSRAEWELACRLLRLLEQCKAHEEALVLAPETSYGMRDGYLAENLAWILAREGPDARVAVLAHNVHAARSGYTASWDGTEAPALSMGARMADVLGDEYLALGFFAYRGDLLPHPSGVVSKKRSDPGTLNDAFFRTGFPAFALDLRGAPTTGRVGRWLAAEHPQSWGFPLGSAITLPQHFDGVVFVDRTSVPTD